MCKRSTEKKGLYKMSNRKTWCGVLHVIKRCHFATVLKLMISLIQKIHNEKYHQPPKNHPPCNFIPSNSTRL